MYIYTYFIASGRVDERAKACPGTMPVDGGGRVVGSARQLRPTPEGAGAGGRPRYPIVLHALRQRDPEHQAARGASFCNTGGAFLIMFGAIKGHLCSGG